MSRRRTALLALLAVAVMTLLAQTAAASTSAPAATEEGDGITVTVPTISYGPRDDVFRVGPYRSRLHVLFNDIGLPAPTRLQLVDRRGVPRTTVTVPRLARLRVVAGYVVLDPVRGARGRFSFTYRAASPNGPAANGHAVVALFPRVVVAAKDRGTTKPGTRAVIDVAANDRIVVNGAVFGCAPELFAHPPRRPDPLPLVLPEPDRRSIDCTGHHRVRLSSAHGEWLVDGRGRVVFRPAAGFTGTVQVYYRQASAHPFDLGLARVTVSVRQPGSAVLGTNHSQGGSLAATGAAVAAVALLAVTLTYLGMVLMRAARKQRQPIDLEA